MKLRKCKFYIGWAAFSPNSCGEDTGLNEADDLLKPELEVDVFEYEAPEGFEWQVGAGIAFEHNWTAEDSMSLVLVENNGEFVKLSS
jgi:hypothetical protein